MLLDAEVEVIWAGSNRKHYESRGYVFTGYGTAFKIPPTDLTDNSDQLVRVKCVTCGTLSTIKYYAYRKRLNKGNCKQCVPQATKDLVFIRGEFAKRGYTLLTDHYVNAHQHLEYICEKHPGSVKRIIYNSLQRGSGCMECGLATRGDRRALKMEVVMQLVDTLPYTFVSCDLTAGSKSRVHLYCDKHQLHFESAYNNLQQGCGCPECALDKVRGTNSFFYKGTTIYPSQYIRSYLKEWKLQAAHSADYRCELTGLGKQLTDFDVHHTESSTTLLLNLLYEQYGDTELPKSLSKEIIDTIMPAYLAAHSSIKGVFMGHGIHKLYHAVYGRNDSCLADYEEFRSDFMKGWIVFSKNTTYWKPKRSKTKNKGALDDQTSHGEVQQSIGVV